jgi:lipoate-protein ligase A
MKLQWRLVCSPPLPGSWNMAVDEAMLLAHSAGLTIPTLRLYRWSPPAVSIGLLQPIESISEEACRQLGFNIVRRPSGGGAVLHQHEITYAVVVDGRVCPEGSSVMATYRWLAKGLTAGLRKLGIEASLSNSNDRNCPSQHHIASFCFARTSAADLTVEGLKLGGSAQARRRHFLLQHGSIPLRLDTETVEQIFGLSGRKNFTCLEEVLEREVSPCEFVEALVAGFSEALGVSFIVSGLTPIELRLAEILFQHKYNTEEWTRERKVRTELPSKVKEILKQSEP